jgi:hypothetical protein
MGERYAQILIGRAAQIDQLKAERIASRLVYGYTHHLFPIDITEASDIGLKTQEMSQEEYETAIEIVSICNDNQVCVEFVNGHEEPGTRGGSSQAGAVPEAAAPAGAQETVSEPLSSSP